MRVVGTCVAAGIAFSSLALHGCGDAASQTHAEANSTDANSTDDNSTHDNSTHAETHSEPATTFPPLPPAYYALPKAACCCPKEDELESIDMCHNALHFVAAHLGFHSHEAQGVNWNGTDEHIPPGCSFKVWPSGKTGRGHWNRAETGKGRDNMIPICHNSSAGANAHATSAPAVNHTDDHTERLFDASIRGAPTSRVAPSLAFLAISMFVAAVSLAVVFRRGMRLNQPSAEDATSLVVEDDECA